MSSLSKITIEDIKGKIIQFKIERIHPDAPSLNWLNKQSEQQVKTSLLFRLMILLEMLHSEDGNISKLYENIYSLLAPYIEEEDGEYPEELSKYTELTSHGSSLLTNIVDKVIVSAKIIAQDINDNWEEGLMKKFNPYKSDYQGIPFVTFEVELKEAFLEATFIGKENYSALGISCMYT